MQCPSCSGALQETSFPGKLVGPDGRTGEVTMDKCGECGGMWFDEAEIEETMGARTPLATLANLEGVPGNRTCPRCQVALDVLTIFDTEVDTCGQCAGVWLDPGELKTLYAAYKENHQTDNGMRCGACGSDGHTEAHMNYTERGLVCGPCFSKAEAKWHRAEQKAMDTSAAGIASSAFGPDVGKVFKPLKVKSKVVDKDGVEHTKTSQVSFKINGVEAGGLFGMIKGMFQ